MCPGDFLPSFQCFILRIRIRPNTVQCSDLIVNFLKTSYNYNLDLRQYENTAPALLPVTFRSDKTEIWTSYTVRSGTGSKSNWKVDYGPVKNSRICNTKFFKALSTVWDKVCVCWMKWSSANLRCSSPKPLLQWNQFYCVFFSSIAQYIYVCRVLITRRLS
jgi:hypothetical protein